MVESTYQVTAENLPTLFAEISLVMDVLGYVEQVLGPGIELVLQESCHFRQQGYVDLDLVEQVGDLGRAALVVMVMNAACHGRLDNPVELTVTVILSIPINV